MLTINQIREDSAFITGRLKIKNFNAEEILSKIIRLDSERREIQTKSDALQNEMNNVSKTIGTLMQQGKKEEAEAQKQKTYSLKEDIKNLQDKVSPIEAELKNEIVKLPNLPHESVPAGKSSDDNAIVRQGGDMPLISENALPHWELIKKYNIVDFDLGVKLTGAGFPVYFGKGAKLQRALINFFLDEGIKAGYQEVAPPIMVNEDSGFGTCNLPDKEGQMYHIQLDNFYLIPTAEVPVTNIYRDVIVNSEALPIRNIAYTPCFRREAGSWGAHVRGLNRLHQFDKVEIVQIAHPDNSYQSLDEMVSHVESLISQLELPYRIVKLCGGDMSFASAMTYDFEVWSAAQKRWLEVSSVSNFESFQSNRLKCRFKEKGDKQSKLVHTLNGSALALPRIVAAIIENNQTDNGIKIPQALTPYTGFDVIN